MWRRNGDHEPMNEMLTGVRTTGIYCRSSCSGRPLARNTSQFASAVAAEAAGFRPCLRCRPDRLPPFVDGDGTGIVGSALSLIAEGALDHASEDAIAQRLGVTARHLRRLFNERVGATPALVAGRGARTSPAACSTRQICASPISHMPPASQPSAR